MRETRNALVSIFHFYAPHALGNQLRLLSDLLDDHPLILDCVERDFRVPDTAAIGASGLSVESVFRCLLLKQILMSRLLEHNTLSLDWLRIDSTVSASNIAPPKDSQLLADGVRVLSRLMSQSKDATGVKIRFSDQGKKSKSLSYRILNAKKVEKEALYRQLISCALLVSKQSRSAIDKLRLNATNPDNA